MAASVVIVSDEPALCDRLEAPLTAAGWEVRRSRRTSAGERARETRQTAWVIDARGNLGGALELLRLLRALGRRFAPLSLAVMDTADPAVARSLLDAGAQVALGADDPLLFGSRLAGQYATMRAAHELDDDQLAELARMSVRGSRAPDDVRARVLDEIDAWLAPAAEKPARMGT